MLLSKKDTPKQFHGMWYAGVLNISVSAVNSYIYHVSGSTISLISAIIPLMVAIVIFIVIKRMTIKMLWDKLTKCAEKN